MKLTLQKYSYRFAEQVLNSKLEIKQEIEDSISSLTFNPGELTSKHLNRLLDSSLVAKGWKPQPYVYESAGDPDAKMDFYKSRVGVEVELGHPSFIGIDLLKFQVASYADQNIIDVGVYIVTTNSFQKKLRAEYGLSWQRLTYEKVVRYLPYLKSAIQVPVYVIGIDA
jgi:hypothetical protein